VVRITATAEKLNTSFAIADYFTPCNQQELFTLDSDSGRAHDDIADPDGTYTQLATFGGKEGSIYLSIGRRWVYNRDHGRGQRPMPDNVLQKLGECWVPRPTNSMRTAMLIGRAAYFSDANGISTFILRSVGSNPPYKLANAAVELATVMAAPLTRRGHLP